MIKLGILGGGQLGRMTIQAAIDMDVLVRIMDMDSDCPASEIAGGFTQGDIQSEEDVYSWGKVMDIITVEIENVNVEALERLEREGVKVYPQPSVIKTIKDKTLQKIFYRDNNIPSSEFVILKSKEEMKKYAAMFPVVNKLAKDGYDGRGVRVLETVDQWKEGFGELSLIERRVDIAKELSVIVARNGAGEIKTYPPVELVYYPELNMLNYLLSPAEISKELKNGCEYLSVQIIEKLKMIGLLAVELFYTRSGELLVNEIAPRPHNSGHHTIEGNITSQYHQFLRSILGLPLGDTSIRSACGMVNLIGANDCRGVTKYEGIDEVIALKNVYVHLYGKAKTKPNRKMGHVTVLEGDKKRLKEKLQWIKKTIKIKA